MKVEKKEKAPYFRFQGPKIDSVGVLIDEIL